MVNLFSGSTLNTMLDRYIITDMGLWVSCIFILSFCIISNWLIYNSYLGIYLEGFSCLATEEVDEEE